MFISFWILAPGVGQYLSHAASVLFTVEDKHTGHTAELITTNNIMILLWRLGNTLTNCSLYFPQDLVVGNRSPALVVSNDLRLLINFLRKKKSVQYIIYNFSKSQGQKHWQHTSSNSRFTLNTHSKVCNGNSFDCKY